MARGAGRRRQHGCVGAGGPAPHVRDEGWRNGSQPSALAATAPRTYPHLNVGDPVLPGALSYSLASTLMRHHAVLAAACVTSALLLGAGQAAALGMPRGLANTVISGTAD